MWLNWSSHPDTLGRTQSVSKRILNNTNQCYRAILQRCTQQSEDEHRSVVPDCVTYVLTKATFSQGQALTVFILRSGKGQRNPLPDRISLEYHLLNCFIQIINLRAQPCAFSIPSSVRSILFRSPVFFTSVIDPVSFEVHCL